MSDDVAEAAPAPANADGLMAGDEKVMEADELAAGGKEEEEALEAQLEAEDEAAEEGQESAEAAGQKRKPLEAPTTRGDASKAAKTGGACPIQTLFQTFAALSSGSRWGLCAVMRRGTVGVGHKFLSCGSRWCSGGAYDMYKLCENVGLGCLSADESCRDRLHACVSWMGCERAQGGRTLSHAWRGSICGTDPCMRPMRQVH